MLRERLDRLNSDMLIGPNAPGDGDIVSWQVCVCFIGVQHLAIATKQDMNPNLSIEGWRLPIGTPKLGPIEHFKLVSEHTIKQFFFQNDSAELMGALPELVQDLAHELSIQWGGRKVRVGVRRKLGDKTIRIADELRNKTPIKDIPKKTGISRATVYRILKKLT